MSAQDLLGLLVEGDDQLDANKAIAALTSAIADLIEDGINIDGNTALRLFAAQLDYVSTTLAQILVGQQSDLVAAHRALDELLTGQPSQIPQYDLAAQTAMLLSNFEIQNLARTYDAMLEAQRVPAPRHYSDYAPEGPDESVDIEDESPIDGQTPEEAAAEAALGEIDA